jgi:hypothetical protein
VCAAGGNEVGGESEKRSLASGRARSQRELDALRGLLSAALEVGEAFSVGSDWQEASSEIAASVERTIRRRELRRRQRLMRLAALPPDEERPCPGDRPALHPVA